MSVPKTHYSALQSAPIVEAALPAVRPAPSKNRNLEVSVRGNHRSGLSQAATLLAAATLALQACRPELAGVPSPALSEQYQAVLRALAQAGYAGPVAIGEAVGRDFRGESPPIVRLFVPEPGRSVVLSRLATEPGLAAALALEAPRAASADGEITNPDFIDLANNTSTRDLRFVAPSVLNGPQATQFQSTIRQSITFVDYDATNDQFFVVQAGQVLESHVTARNWSAGHWHGDSLNLRQLPRRVGRVEPETGSFSGGSWANTWDAPEFAQEVFDGYLVRASSGPHAGEDVEFFALAPIGTRWTGLQRLPPDATYDRVGGTTPHPEAFNDWGEAGLIGSIQSFAHQYNRMTGDRIFVNDISLFFGGKLDLDTLFLLGGAAHQEHRFGTEADLQPRDRTTQRRVDWFRRLASRNFTTVYVHSTDGRLNHLHVRSPASRYNK